MSFDLSQGHSTQLSEPLPISVRFGAAIKFGKSKAYLFPVGTTGVVNTTQSGHIWEMDVPTTTFTKRADITLPVFEQNPAVVTDQTFIYVMAKFQPTSTFMDTQGMFKIDPAAGTSKFLQVSNWPLRNTSRIYDRPPLSVYVAKTNRIYSFGGRSVSVTNTNIRDHDEIFYIDLNPNKTDQGGQQNVTSVTSTETSTRVTQLKNEPLTEATTETSTKIQDLTLNTDPTVRKFVCSDSIQGNKRTNLLHAMKFLVYKNISILFR